MDDVRSTRARLRIASAASLVVAFLCWGLTPGGAPTAVAAPLAPVSKGGVWKSFSPSVEVGPHAGSKLVKNKTRTLTVPKRKGFNRSNARVVVQVTVVGAKSAGELRVWTSGAKKPRDATLRFAKGTSSATTFAILDTNGRLSVTANRSARLRIEVVGWFTPTKSANPGPGGTKVITPVTVVDTAAQVGAWPAAQGKSAKVSVLGLGDIPQDDVRAVWLSVQAHGRTPGTLALGSGSGAGVAFGRSWSTSLVQVPVDDTGSILLTSRTGRVDGLRIVVLGWTAEQTAQQSTANVSGGTVLAPARARKVRSIGAKRSEPRYQVSVSGDGVPSAARQVVATADVTLKNAGRIAVAETSALLTKKKATLSQGQHNGAIRLTFVAPVKNGRFYVSLPQGAKLARVTTTGYLYRKVSSKVDRSRPSLTIRSHMDGSRVAAGKQSAVTFSGTVKDAQSGIRSVMVFGGGALVGAAKVSTVRGTPTWTFTTAVPPGKQRLKVVALNGAGRRTERSIILQVEDTPLKATIIAPDVKVAGASLLQDIKMVEPSSITVRGRSSSVAVGDVLVAGVSAATPEGLARRVVSVVLRGGQTTIRTEQAVLTDIFHQVDIARHDVSISADLSAATDTAAGGMVAPRMQLSGSFDLLALTSPARHADRSAKLNVGIDAGISIDAVLKISWTKIFWVPAVPHVDRFDLLANIDSKTSVGLDSQISLPGVFPKLRFDHTLLQRSLPVITIPAGPVPLVFAPSAEVALTGEITIGVTASFEQSLSARMGPTIDDSGVGFTFEPTHQTDGLASPALGAKTTIGVALRVPIRLYGLTGVYVKAGAELDASAATTFSGGLERQAGVSLIAAVGADVAILGKQFAKAEQEWNFLRYDIGTVGPEDPPSLPTPTPVPSTSATTSPIPSPTRTPEPTTAPDEPEPEPFARGTVLSLPYGGDRKLVPIPGLEDMRDVAGGWCDVIALDGQGQVWEAGANSAFGESCDGTTEIRFDVVKVPGLSRIVDIAAGNGTGYAVQDDGTVWGWGRVITDGVADESSPVVSTPYEVETCNAVGIEANALFALALCSDGTVESWGANEFSELGRGAALRPLRPGKIDGLNQIVEISAGSMSAYARNTDGTVWQWGYITRILVNGRAEHGVLERPVVVEGLPPVESVSAGVTGVYALDARGGVWGWQQGGLDIRNMYFHEHPARVDLPPMASVWAASTGAFAVTSSGEWWALGGPLNFSWEEGDALGSRRIPELDQLAKIIQIGSSTYGLVL